MEEMAEVVQTLRRVVDRVQRSTVGVPTAELMGDVGILQEVISAASAAQTVRIAQFAAREEMVDEDGMQVTADRGVGYVSEFAGDELAPVLGMAPMMATRRVRTSAKLLADLPVTLRAVADGQLDPFRAQAVAEELELADRDVCTAVEGMVHPGVCGDTPGRVRARVRRALADVDPLAVREAAVRARADRFVRVWGGDVPGMSSWWASLPAAESVACWAAIDDVAHRMKTEDPSKKLDACRADAMVDLILARTEVSTTVTIGVPVHTMTDSQGSAAGTAFMAGSEQGEDEGVQAVPHPVGFAFASSCDVPGVGMIPPDVVNELIGRFDTRIARMLIDAATGVTVETSAPRYRPSAAIRTFVRARDGTCRFPGCGASAKRCDLDHVISWPLGPTVPGNLVCLCRHHHRLKTHTAWRAVLHPGGKVTWTDPYGQQWVTHPIDHYANYANDASHAV